MPLLDHFHEPIEPRAEWQSFHNRWANAIADGLDQELPNRYFARVQVNLGREVEADVAEFQSTEGLAMNGSQGGVAVDVYAPPVATAVVSAIFPDEIEVQVRDNERGARLAAVIEMVSPSNKDREDHRRAFAIKCVAYLQQGVGLVVIDTVTARRFDLHEVVLSLLGIAVRQPSAEFLQAVAYRPANRSDSNEIDIWQTALVISGLLPTLPLALRGN
ncbi:MAG: DUF4058 family protein, partial [Candidatus Acidiferrum sp.]